MPTLRVIAVSVFLVACTDDAAAPVAPSALAVSPLGAGAHLTWKDNSSDETEFVIMRKDGGGAMSEIARVPFNGTTYHDEPITSGTSYIYKIVATNQNGDSESNEAMFVAP